MAENIKRHITHIKSKVVEEGSPKLPTSSQIELGELAINYAKGFETLSIKNESGDVVTFNTDTFYGTCTTAAATKDKVVTLSNASGWRLKSGVIVGVKFSNSNSFSGGTNGYPTLNVNSSGAKYIWYNTTSANTGTNNTAYGTANRISYYMYDGIGWVWVNQSVDNNTTYSTMSAAELSAGTATSQRVMTAQNLKTGGDKIWQAKGSYPTTSRKISTASGLTGGGDLSADRTIGLVATGTSGTYKQVVVDAYGRVTSGNTADNNTWRSIKVNGTNFLTDTSTALNLSGGSNVTLTTGSTGLITIAATDTKYTAATAAPGKVATNSASGTSTNYARQDHTHGIDLATGDANGQVKIAGTNVSVKGLGTAAYKAEGYFAGSGHSHTNMVTGSSLTANNIILGNGSSAIKDSGKSIETTLSSTLDTKIPTSKAIADYVTSQMTSVLTYKGAISANATLQNAHKVGDVYVVSSAGTYAGKACEVGDYLIANTARESASTVTNADWDAINGENQVENKSASLAAAGSSATLATVDGTNITVTTPSTWTGVAKTGTVTKVSTASGLTGGNITSTGTIGLAATGTSGTYYCVKTDAYGRVTSGNTSNPNTDTAVTQTNITTNGNYEVLLAGSTATATTTTEASKNVGITYNPSTSALTVNKKITTIAANNFITGSGTSATTATVKTATYCYPAKWSYNKATTVADGDMFTIKIPIAGHTYGVYMSVNNGTNYYPIVLNGTVRLTTQYPVGSYITVVYETGGTAASIYPVNGAASGSTGTSAAGVFRVVNYYDSNTTYSVVDNTYLRYNTLKAANAIYRYQLLLTKDETSLLPINSNSNTTATTKTITNSKFDPFGNIYYYGVTATTNANTAIPTGRTYQEILLDLRYSFNTNKALTASKSVYLVATPQDDGTAIIANRTTTGVSINGPISQTLPATDNGLIYIYLGTAYSTYQVNLSLTHPIYQYKNGTLNQYVGSFGSMAYEDSTSYSSATEVNTALAGKSGTGHTHDNRYYTESELTGSSTTVVVAKASSATTAASAGSVAWGNVSGKPSTFTPSAHNQASSTINSMSGYTKPSATSAIATGDTLNAAIGKLEKALNDLNAAIEDLSGQSETVAAALNGLNTKKLDASAYTPVHYSKVSVTGNLTNVTCPVTLSTDGEQCNVLYVNDSTQHTVSISTNYKSLDNRQINLTIKANGYAEVNYLYFGGYIYVRAA